MAVSSDDGMQLFGYTEPARAPQNTTTDTDIISHSGENVNTSVEENSGKTEHSIADIIKLSPIEINKKNTASASKD